MSSIDLHALCAGEGSSYGPCSSSARLLVKAARKGNFDDVNALVDAGADVNCQWHSVSALHSALRSQSIPCIRRLLEAGADLNDTRSSSVSVLHLAAKIADPAVLRVFLHYGSGDMIDAKRNTVLHCAAKRGRCDNLTQILRGTRPAVDARNSKQQTPLMCALRAGRSDAATLLLSYGAGVLCEDGSGLSPLEHAVAGGSLACVGAVVKALCVRPSDVQLARLLRALHFSASLGGAVPTPREETQTALQPAEETAIHNGTHVQSSGSGMLQPSTTASFAEPPEHAVASYLLQAADACGLRADSDTRTGVILLAAVKSGALAIVRALLQRGADPNSTEGTDCEGLLRSALALAAYSGHEEMVQALLCAGAVDTATESALYAAAKRGHARVVQLLLLHRTSMLAPMPLSPTTATAGLSTPIHAAARAGHTDIVRLLLEAGQPIDAVTRGGDTPLSMAARNGHLSTVQLLLQRGASLQCQFCGGWAVNAVVQAATHGHIFVCEALLQSAGHICAPVPESLLLLEAARHDSVELCALFLKYGANPAAADPSGTTALHAAAAMRHHAVCALLIAHGAPLNQQNNDGATPLTLAACMGSLDTCALLLGAGADACLPRFDGASPLTMAVCYNQPELVALLLRHGADPGNRDSSGRAVLAQAAARGRLPVVQMLVRAGADVWLRDRQGESAVDVARGRAHRDVEAYLRGAMLGHCVL